MELSKATTNMAFP